MSRRQLRADVNVAIALDALYAKTEHRGSSGPASTMSPTFLLGTPGAPQRSFRSVPTGRQVGRCPPA